MKKIIKVYDPAEAPVDAVFITSKVEVNGIIIYDIPDYKMADTFSGKKLVYFYEIEDKKQEISFKNRLN